MSTTDDALAGVEAARARVAGQIAQAEARRAGIHALADEIRALSATVRSSRGEVQVTAMPGGQVTAVTFSSIAEQLDAASLSAIATRTVAEAQQRAAELAVELASEKLGAESPFVAQLRGDVAGFGR
ncbi:YbaB/EbfC family nucleoid-associated protein [Agromyces sp. NPDC058136]|uniref:YbaB/EbfC family nucleoid-associated protein n=1 Tax=Agromyces sp. NPDC058136 TaxID=3346354 RepID=UPI0036D7AF23